jgi:uncharacterized protein (TIGR00251 family)
MEEILSELSAKGSVIFIVRVQPSATKTAWKEPLTDGTLRLSLHAPAEHGKANRELLQFLSQECSIPLSCIDLLAGQASRTKVVRIRLLACSY